MSERASSTPGRLSCCGQSDLPRALQTRRILSQKRWFAIRINKPPQSVCKTRVLWERLARSQAAETQGKCTDSSGTLLPGHYWHRNIGGNCKGHPQDTLPSISDSLG